MHGAVRTRNGDPCETHNPSTTRGPDMSHEGVERFVRLLIADERFVAEAESDLDTAVLGFDLTDEEKEYLAGHVNRAVLDVEDTGEHPQGPPIPRPVVRPQL